MITIDQFRISDDGRTMYLDAHVNKTNYFKDVYIDDVTIVTEDSVLKNSSEAINKDYIYKEEMYPNPVYEPLMIEPITLNEEELSAIQTSDNAWKLEVGHSYDTPYSTFNVFLTSKIATSDGSTPYLVVAKESYTIAEGLEGESVLKAIKGKSVTADKDGESVIYWQFKGQVGSIENSAVLLYLYCKDKDSNLHSVSLETTQNEESSDYIAEDVTLSYMQYAEYKMRSLKEIHLVLDRNSFNERFCEKDLSKHIYFVYIKASGTPAPNTPCRLDEMTTIAVTLDYNLIYQAGLGYMREMNNTCSLPKGFIDFILNFNAMKMAIETEHYCPAIEFFKRLTDKGYNSNTLSGTATVPCGCHG